MPSVDGIIQVDRIQPFIVLKNRSIFALSCQTRTLPRTCLIPWPLQASMKRLRNCDPWSLIRNIGEAPDLRTASLISRFMSFVLGRRAKALIASSLRKYPSSTAAISNRFQSTRTSVISVCQTWIGRLGLRRCSARCEGGVEAGIFPRPGSTNSSSSIWRTDALLIWIPARTICLAVNRVPKSFSGQSLRIS